jgi:hypothetical protein
MSTLQTDITRLLGMKTIYSAGESVRELKHHFQASKLQLCSLQWPGRAEVHLPAKFLSPVASGSCHQVQVRDVDCHQRKLNERCGTTSVFTGVEKFRAELDIARSMLNIRSGPLPIGAGFLGWKLDEAGSEQIPLLELALENGVRAIWLSFGQDLGRWIEFVRNHDQKSGKSPNTLVFVQVNSVDQALVAAQAWKVDVLVAQGN